MFYCFAGVSDTVVKLHKNFNTIVHEIDNTTTRRILDYLISVGIIDHEENEEIASCTTPKQMNRCLLYVARRKGDKGFECLQNMFGQLTGDLSQQVGKTEVTNMDRMWIKTGR